MKAFICLLLSLVSVCYSAAPANQVQFLNQFFTATNGNSWISNTGWTAGGDPCADSWVGIKCDTNGNIIQLELNNNGLSGTLPQDWSVMNTLQVFELSNNKIGGVLPVSIFSIAPLVRLELSENELTGTIPDASALVNVISLEIFKNQLTGTIPSNLGDLPALARFSLNDNKLTGSMPASLGMNTALTLFRLDQNQLTGTVPIPVNGFSNIEQGDFNISCNCYELWPSWCFDTFCQPCFSGPCNATNAKVSNDKSAAASVSADFLPILIGTVIVSLAAIVF